MTIEQSIEETIERAINKCFSPIIERMDRIIDKQEELNKKIVHNSILLEETHDAAMEVIDMLEGRV